MEKPKWGTYEETLKKDFEEKQKIFDEVIEEIRKKELGISRGNS